MQLIPAIDLLDGGVVRLLRGDFAEVTRYDRGAVVLAAAFRDAGAQGLHVVDLNAARGDTRTNRTLVRELAAVDGLRVQCAGGVKSEEDVRELLDAGAERVVIGSLAVNEPARVAAWLEQFGRERVALALDVRLDAAGEPELLTRGWREASGLSLWPLLDRYAEAGLRHLLCTDVSRDGTLQGPNLDLYRAVLERHPGLAVQASGGIGSVEHVRALRDGTVPAAVLGRALLEGRVSLGDALRAAA